MVRDMPVMRSEVNAWVVYVSEEKVVMGMYVLMMFWYLPKMDVLDCGDPDNDDDDDDDEEEEEEEEDVIDGAS
jgi:hypothetical protein